MKEQAKKLIKDKKLPKDEEKACLDLIDKMALHSCFGNPEYQWSLDDFELAHRIGRGKFGRVFLARERRTEYIVAIKTLLKREIVREGVERQILSEIEVQSHLKHPHVLQLLCWFHDPYRIYLIVEYAGEGELYRHLQKSGHFDEHLSAKYIYQVADALDYCHQNNVIHRDIKPENLLLTFEGDVKVADFGWSVHTRSEEHQTLCGTLDYLAPEMVENRKYGKYIDHWCLGILCYEFLVGHPPFESKEVQATYSKIRALNIEYPKGFPEGAKDLISKLLIKNTKQRLTLPKVMEHPWIVENRS